MKIKTIIKNISYSISSNLISFTISALLILVLPKFITLRDYGLWQLFLFYFSYVGFFHFGWEDGIYLRYAGKNYKDLNYKLFAGQVYSIIFFQIILGIVMFVLTRLFVEDIIKQNIIYTIILMMIIVNFNNFCNLIFQATNEIFQYSRLILVEQVSFFMFVLLSIVLGFNQYTNIIFCKMLSVILVALMGSYSIRDILLSKVYTWTEIRKEGFKNLNVGSKLMLSNIASMLILGIVRYGISEKWDIATFGKISLTLSISNFLMVFISSISVVVFPLLKNASPIKLASIYIDVRKGLSVILFGLLTSYYPLHSVFSFWLPQYKDSLQYMALLFPVCLFESRVALLINTYLKSMRQEKLMLKINIFAVFVSFLLTFLGAVILHDLNFTVFSIILVFAIRCTVAEIYLCKLLSLHSIKGIFYDILMVMVFIVTSWKISGLVGLMIYAVAYIIYIFLNKEVINVFGKYIKATKL